MRKLSILPALAGVLGLLLVVGAARHAAFATSTNDQDSQLKSELEAALARNPDVLLAQAKVREAEAELNRVRLSVTRDLVGNRVAVDGLERKLGSARKEFKRLQALGRSGQIEETSIDRQALLVADLEVELLDARAVRDFLVGKGGVDAPAGDRPAQARTPRRVREPFSPRDEQILEATFALAPGEYELSRVFDAALGGSSIGKINYEVDRDMYDLESKVAWRFEGDVTIAAMFDWLRDINGGVPVVLFRSYGPFFTQDGTARFDSAPSWPANYELVR
ncbi:MAG: hypothetical protein R3F20_05375 [Planctomycetota bacterium]